MANGFQFKVFYVVTWNEVATKNKALVKKLLAVAADHQGRNNDYKYYGMGQQLRH